MLSIISSRIKGENKVKLIVGLGNPGKEYDYTRHNFGFAVLDALAKKYGGKFSLEKKFKAEVAEIFIGGEKIFLVKPQTFMNKSGESVREVMSYYNITTDRVWIIYDDIDIDLGQVRVRSNGGSAGHKGVQSIIDSVGTELFPRFRMGISSNHCDELSTEDVVLQRFAKDEEPKVDQAITKAINEIENALSEGIEHLSV
jgi:PTH1 family peptidyl-tRNA hydrolase